MWSRTGPLLLLLLLGCISADEQEQPQSDEIEGDDSIERLGPVVTQIVRHRYAASLLENGEYVCSAVILNKHWLLTLSKCFDGTAWPNCSEKEKRRKRGIYSDVINSYVTTKNLGNYTVRVGSSYNSKGGTIFKLRNLINNFDMKISAVKLKDELVFGTKIGPVTLPAADEEVSLGYLASAIAWTPTGHIRLVNLPVVDPFICENDAKYTPSTYICVSGVQDPNRHFCRRDHGGAVTQNNTLIALTNFLHTCALYTKVHSFPKIGTIVRWLDSVIWDEENRPSTDNKVDSTTAVVTEKVSNQINQTEDQEIEEVQKISNVAKKYMLTLPFDPVNVPLEPAEDNSVLPRMSLYESYLQNMKRQRQAQMASSTRKPLNDREENERKLAWLQKYGKAMMMMSPGMY